MAVRVYRCCSDSTEEENEASITTPSSNDTLLCGDWGRLLRLAGFRGVSFYGKLGNEAYGRSSSRCLICVAER